MTHIPRFDFAALVQPGHSGHREAREAVRRGAHEVGFLTVFNTPIARDQVEELIAAYSAFFHLPEDQKSAVDMARTGSNRGWGAPRSEQVDPGANPDYKEVFDCGVPLPEDDPFASLSVYAPNLWPEGCPGFRETIETYFHDAMGVARALLRGVADAIGEDPLFFDDKFDRPMALLRGNYYPARPAWAGDKDFGIAAHTDYGCLTLLATDGAPGLEVMGRDRQWAPLSAPTGEFVVNFGEMLEIWTAGRVAATPHRVVGGTEERISVPLFFNPNHDANVAPIGSGRVVLAGEHLGRRFAQTYVHLKAV